ncbi:lipase secretion chaperone [Agarilytica rhodophyticola]|uniref:lipase secretion chaperone n=1 Tax=Agarilytica rhodophyticola TaxID=1737490 RepID=UPI000B3495F4|nr:lipase secretion chaperone [Agarilytica rhodophyticola]
MKTQKIPSIYIILGTLLVFGLVMFIWMNQENNVSINNKTQHSLTTTTTGDVNASESIAINPQVREKIREKNNSETPFRFDIEYIFNALSRVSIDSNGNVVVDHNAKDLLESAFMHVSFDLTESELVELGEYIQLGISGVAGEQAAKIVRDYYDYRIEEKDFMATHQASDLNDMLNNFEQITAIRRANLGYEVADKLYGLDEINNRYTIESMVIQSDIELDKESRIKQQKLLSQKYELDKVAYHFDDPNFKSRYDQFLQEKQHILDANLGENQEQKQIAALLEQHFERDVIEKVRRYANLK